MKAFRYAPPLTGLQLQEVPIPKPGEGQVLLEVQAAGLCHSDKTIMDGDIEGPVQVTPITLGHEVAGTVVKLGSGPGPWPVQIGDRVAIAQICQPIDKLDWRKAPGLGHDGGYARYTLAYSDRLVPIPEGVSFAQAAVATDAISTAYHAVLTEGQVTESTTVAILGLGGLGLNGVALAALKGARVYGVDVNTAKFDEAKTFGAVDCASSLQDLDVSVDVVVDFVGQKSTTAAAISAVRMGGRVVLVGMGAETGELPIVQLASRGVTLQGSLGASKEELLTVLDLIASGRLSPKLQEIPFTEVEKALNSLNSNQISGRLFTCPVKG